jgi:hypothetical protein
MNLKNKIFLGITLLLMVVGIPAVVFLSQQRQETRSRASQSTTLYFVPLTASSTPLRKAPGEIVSFDVMIDPGSNRPSLIRLEIPYDGTKLTPTATPFIVNTAAFPTTQEGPFVRNNSILISVSVGNDPSKAISQVTKVGTVSFTADAITASPSMISFGSSSQVLSVASTDEANENVLSTTTPAYVAIANAPTSTPTITPTATPNPTSTPTPTPTPIHPPTSTPTSVPNSTKISLNVFIHGIGNSGDNTNPTNFSLSNKNPLVKNRTLDVQIINNLNQIVAQSTASLSYDSTTGSFKGTADLGNSFPSTGSYNIKAKGSTQLRRLIPGIQTITIGQTNSIPDITIITGDINSDNVLNILDYNLLIGCYSDLAPATSCTTTNKILTDLNDNGSVNQFDYNLFLRELAVQLGQ